ncbi:MAG: XTP/dITP diphosphatase [Dehalococcoidales bacterium]|nr:XTP/dITP diphosphatase [Dehalococcoidales bacterium]
MLTIVLATNNPGKVREYRELLEGIYLRLVMPAKIGVHIEVEETGSTFAENAIIKARAYARASGLYALADDSGLEVDALGGQPGVLSARYAGAQATDAERVQALLTALKDVPPDKRSARFRCVIALASPDGDIVTGEGTCEGRISFAPKGTHGFGYDPIFYLPDMGKTMAQIPPEVKNRISHRASAAQAIRPVLSRLAAQACGC